MLGLFSDAFHDPGTYLKRQPSEAYLTRRLARDTLIAVAAFAAGEVVGGLASYVHHKVEQERSEFYIYDLAIAEHFRRQGIATELIKTIKVIVQQRGIHVIFVQADDGDDSAVAVVHQARHPRTCHALRHAYHSQRGLTAQSTRPGRQSK